MHAQLIEYNKLPTQKIIIKTQNSKYMFDQSSTLKKLLQKVRSDIPQIQTRSLNNIYTKLTHQLITIQNLLQYPQFPGVILSWINDNKKKSQILLKVIYILAKYTEVADGLVLLRRYQCLEFCEEFKIYLIQNQRGVDVYVEELQNIIRKLLPLGRADESSQPNNQIIAQNTQKSSKPTNPNPNKSSQTQNPSKQRSAALFLPLTLKFSQQSLPLSESQDKTIFQLFMTLKYTQKQTIHPTLTQLRRLTHHHMHNTYRCKSDLITYLAELAQANIYPELCLEIVGILLHGIVESHMASGRDQGLVVTLGMGKVGTGPLGEIQVGLSPGVFGLIGSFAVLEEVLAAFRADRSCIPISYLLDINYKYSAQYFLQTLKSLTLNQLTQYFPNYLPTLQSYCQTFVQKSPQFLQILPQSLWRQTKTLSRLSATTQKSGSHAHLHKYLSRQRQTQKQQQFQITKNLHIMRQIIDDLRAGMKGVEVGTVMDNVKLYVDVLAVLAISVSKQDHIMSYYGEAQEMVMNLANNSNNQVVIFLYQQLLQTLKNTKPIINYPGLMVHKNEVIQIIFTSPEFTKKIFQNSLQNQQTLNIMMHIILHFIQKDRFKIFTPYVPILFALSNHPSQEVSRISTTIIQKMPKSHSVQCIACKLFSTNTQNRKKLLSDLSSTKLQGQPDIIQRISTGQFINRKKQIKLSNEAIDNYFNIVFNPGLDLGLRDSGLAEFVDYLQRIAPGCEYQFGQAQTILVEEIKKMSKKQKLDNFEQKLIILHLTLCQKSAACPQPFSLQFLITLLHKTTTQGCKACLLTSIYVKTFQSPFTAAPLTKNWVMMYYPHVQVLKMNLEHPIREGVLGDGVKQGQSKDKQNYMDKQKQIREGDIYSKGIGKGDRVYLEIVCAIAQGKPISSQIWQKLQQQIVTAVTTTNISNISKLSFLCHQYYHYRKKTITKTKMVNKKARTNKNIDTKTDEKFMKLSKATIKVILQYIRTNAIATDLCDDLVRFLRCGEEGNYEVVGNTSALGYILYSYSSKPTTNEQLAILSSHLQVSITKPQILQHLLSTPFHPALKSSIDQYNSLKLIQSLITTLRSPSSANDGHTRMLALMLLHKLVSLDIGISEHQATLVGVLGTLIMEGRLGVGEFGISLAVYADLVGRYGAKGTKGGDGDIPVMSDKMACTIIQHVCTLISNMSQVPNSTFLSLSYTFLNNLLQHPNPHRQSYLQTIINHPTNMLVLSTTLLPKKLPNLNQSQIQKQLQPLTETERQTQIEARRNEIQRVYVLMTQIYGFLYLGVCGWGEAVGGLLGVTDLLAGALSYIVPLSTISHVYDTSTNITIRVQLLESLSRLLYKLSQSPTQFIFKLNKLLKNQAGNAEYKLHYTLMAPIPLLRQYYKQQDQRLGLGVGPGSGLGRRHQHCYLRFVCWVLYQWRQDTGILEEQEFVRPLVEYALQNQQVRSLTPLLLKSSISQKQVAQSATSLRTLKSYLKSSQQLLHLHLSVKKPLNIGLSRLTSSISPTENIAQLKQKLKQGLILTTTIFNPVEGRGAQLLVDEKEIGAGFRDTLNCCVRLVDLGYSWWEAQIAEGEEEEDGDQEEGIGKILNAAIVSLIRNQLCTKTLSAIITQGNFQTVNKLLTTTISQSQKPPQSILAISQQLQLLSMMTTNESVRSLIIKNKIIQYLTNVLVAMDENKVVKINYGVVYVLLGVFVALAGYKDTNARILNDKRVIQILCKILTIQPSSIIQQKTLQLLTNLSAFKHSKASFMSCKQLHKICLGFLSDPEYEHKQLILKLIYNILYKNAAGIKMYKKKQVIELIEGLAVVEGLEEIAAAVLAVLEGGAD